MNHCQKCNTTGEWKFCPECGSPAVAIPAPPDLEKDLNIVETTAQSDEVQTQQMENNTENFKRKAEETFSSAEQKVEEFKKTTEEYYNKLENTNIIAAVGVLPSMFWIPLLINKENPKYRETVSQGFLAEIVLVLLNAFSSLLSYFGTITFFGIVLLPITGIISYIITIVKFFIYLFAIIGFFKILNGKTFKYPLLGKKEVLK